MFIIIIIIINIYIKSGPVEKRPYFLPTSARTKKGSSMSDQLPHETTIWDRADRQTDKQMDTLTRTQSGWLTAV